MRNLYWHTIEVIKLKEACSAAIGLQKEQEEAKEVVHDMNSELKLVENSSIMEKC